jgi:hypothetical protein
MTTESLLPPFTAAERARELCHCSHMLRQRAKRACARSQILRHTALHLRLGQRLHSPLSGSMGADLRPVNVYEASLSLGA